MVVAVKESSFSPSLLARHWAGGLEWTLFLIQRRATAVNMPEGICCMVSKQSAVTSRQTRVKCAPCISSDGPSVGELGGSAIHLPCALRLLWDDQSLRNCWKGKEQSSMLSIIIIQ